MTRVFVYGVVIPSLLGIAAMAAIVIPRGGHDLTWPRLIAGCAVLVAVQVTGGFLGGRFAARR